MNRRELFHSAGATAFVTMLAGPALAQTALGKPGTKPTKLVVSSSPREDLPLDSGWRFHEGDLPLPALITHDDTYNAAKAGAARGAASPKFDDGAWATVDLPHDFASFQPIEQDANVDQGYRRRGIAWYRNTLRVPESDHGRHIELQIEGAATYSTVWVNGTLVDRNWSGYASAYIDITPYVTYGDTLNHIAIRVDATAMEGWWYEGAGLYRDVRVVKRNPVHIVTDGVFAHPIKGANGWHIPVEVALNNSGKAAADVTVTTELWDDSIGLLAREQSQAKVEPLGDATARLKIVYNTPRLWSPNDPQLYKVVTRIEQAGTLVDQVETKCGFRTERFDAQKGFFLNDKALKIKGVCLHQDHAGVGTAIPTGLMDYRLRRLKTLGCNAIRFSHNAQSRVLMDLCDRHGFLVMAENRNFNPSDDYLAQLRWLVRRDRNHPSIYLWSVFNEEPMQATEQGYEMVRRMSAAVKSLDTSRPVTAAMNGGLAEKLSVANAVDVVGINYQQDKYDVFHAAHPDIPVFSSEDTSAFMTRGEFVSDKDKHVMAGYDDEAAPWGETQRAAWKAVVERPFVAGQFVWTGLDYHGEPTPFIWPSNSSFFGILDLCGFDKAAALIHRAQWIDDTPVVGLAPHWNWKAGDTVRVMACVNTDEVELFINGKSAGRQKGDRLEMNYWQVPYAPGRIEARGYNGGKQVASAVVETVGPAVALRLTPDRPALGGDRDAQPIKVEAVDAKGRTHPFAGQKVTFAVNSGAIIGLGNGNPNCLEAEKGTERSLFNGLAQVIVQTTGATGSLTLSASADGLKPASATIALT